MVDVATMSACITNRHRFWNDPYVYLLDVTDVHVVVFVWTTVHCERSGTWLLFGTVAVAWNCTPITELHVYSLIAQFYTCTGTCIYSYPPTCMYMFIFNRQTTKIYITYRLTTLFTYKLVCCSLVLNQHTEYLDKKHNKCRILHTTLDSNWLTSFGWARARDQSSYDPVYWWSPDMAHCSASSDGWRWAFDSARRPQRRAPARRRPTHATLAPPPPWSPRDLKDNITYTRDLENATYMYMCIFLNVGWTWSVDDVDVVTLPLSVGGSWLDRDASLSLQLHEVHRGANSIFSSHLRKV